MKIFLANIFLIWIPSSSCVVDSKQFLRNRDGAKLDPEFHNQEPATKNPNYNYKINRNFLYCTDLRSAISGEINEVQQQLVKNLACGEGDCGRIVITSEGASALRHPARFGLFNLISEFEERPVYTRLASNQSLFFMDQYEKWDHPYKIQRWIIGPIVGVSEGGLIFLSTEKCPVKMDTESTNIYFYDKLEKNIWNPRGNGWRLEHSNAIKIQCHNPLTNPVFHCGCQTIQIQMSDSHPEVNSLGVYHYDQESTRLGFLSPVYKKEDSSYYLYSHHPKGHLWLVGRSFISWSLRLNLLNYPKEKRPPSFCPLGSLSEEFVWEYLHEKYEEDEIWLSNESIQIVCLKQ